MQVALYYSLVRRRGNSNQLVLLRGRPLVRKSCACAQWHVDTWSWRSCLSLAVYVPTHSDWQVFAQSLCDISARLSTRNEAWMSSDSCNPHAWWYIVSLFAQWKTFCFFAPVSMAMARLMQNWHGGFCFNCLKFIQSEHEGFLLNCAEKCTEMKSVCVSLEKWHHKSISFYETVSLPHLFFFQQHKYAGPLFWMMAQFILWELTTKTRWWNPVNSGKSVPQSDSNLKWRAYAQIWAQWKPLVHRTAH